MFFAYTVIVFSCLAFSLYNKNARQEFLWIYFSVVFFSELLVFNELCSSDLYKFTKIFYVIFFIFYFSRKGTSKLFSNLLSICSFFTIIIILFEGRLYGLDLSILQSFVYLLLSLNWLMMQIKNPNEIKIYKKMSFWISIAIMLWAITYLLRIIPANYFAENDKEFLTLTNNIYQQSTIIIYIFFLRGLFLKYETNSGRY